MNAIRALVFGAVLASWMVGTPASAQRSQEDLNKEVAELRKEVSDLKAELEKMRGEVARAVAQMKAAQRPARQQRPAEALVGQKVPEFTVTTIDGRSIQIGGKREKPQVVFCYASWCGFCKKSMPWIETVWQKYKDKGVEVVALNLDQRGEGGRTRTEEQTLEIYKQLGVTMPMTMTTATNDTSKIGAALKASSFPTLFVMGPSGAVESVHIGAKPGLENIIGKEIDLLLEGKDRSAFPK